MRGYSENLSVVLLILSGPAFVAGVLDWINGDAFTGKYLIAGGVLGAVVGSILHPH